MPERKNMAEALEALAAKLRKEGQGASALGCDPRSKATARIRAQNFAKGRASVENEINAILKQYA